VGEAQSCCDCQPPPPASPAEPPSHRIARFCCVGRPPRALPPPARSTPSLRRTLNAREQAFTLGLLGRGDLPPHDHTSRSSLAATSMSSQAPLTSISTHSDRPLDLTTVFKDSAGLRIARFIVGEYLKEADKQTFAGHAGPSFAQDTFCSVSPLRFDSSPEFRKMLEDRLVFRESEPLTSGQGHLGRSGISRTSSGGFDMSRDCKDPVIDAVGRRRASGGSSADVYSSVNRTRAEQNHQQANPFADIQATSHFSYQQRAAHPSSYRASQIQPSALSHPQFRAAKSQAELDIDALFEEPASKNQGTESPYRVESPSGRASGLSSSQRSPQRWNENDAFASHLPSVEKDPFQLDRGSYSNSSALNYSSQSSVCRQSYLSDSGYFSETQAPSTSNSQSHQRNHNISHYPISSTLQSSPSIKSFLPVNKTTENSASSNVGKNLGFSHSPLSDGTTMPQKD
jgi:hypothetical protein